MSDELTESPARRGLLRRRNAVQWFFPLWRKTLPVYRVMDRLHRSGHPDAALVVSEVWKIFTGIEIIPGAQLADDVGFVHGQGVVVGERTVIGRGTRIFQQVTFGQGRRDKFDMPVVGEYVYIYAGAKLVGGITVGDHAAIGANSVVTRDVPAGAIVSGIPAKVIGWNDGFGPEGSDVHDAPDLPD
jgi:serine O-acetyltransferase